jgi:single-stranded-DNA-specific exonuclease
MLADSHNESGSLVFGKSVKLLSWRLAEADERLVVAFCQKLNIPEVLAIILVNRGIKSVEEAELFLNPKLRDFLPDPFTLIDMDKAAERIAAAVMNQEKVTIYGDYDVDGATSSALLKRFLSKVGLESEVYIPHRINEGYGPNTEAFKQLKEQGTDLVVTVDCGTVSFEPMHEAKQLGMDVIILDHHLSNEVLPEAYAIVNPNRFDENFPIKSIAAVGVVFLTIIAIRAKLREKKWFIEKEIDLLQYLDLVALGTVCDVMHLVGLNRAFVAQGLKLIAARNNLGISTLVDIAQLTSVPQSYHLGYILGPRINAGGRVGEGDLGSELLATEEPHVAYNIAVKLERLNEERRTIEAQILEEAFAQIERDGSYSKPIIIVTGEGWHQGVLGILASRIKEKYSKPVAVISLVDGVGKGSARSIPGIDLGTLLGIAKLEGLLIHGGGHAMAGGFTISQDKIVAFDKFLSDKLVNTESLFEKYREYFIDAVLTIPAVNGKLIEVVNQAAPFGQANPQPKFLLRDVVITTVKVIGKANLMVIVADDKRLAGNANGTLKCIVFKALETAMGNVILNSIGHKVNIVGTIQPNYFDKDKADFIIEDISLVKE